MGFFQNIVLPGQPFLQNAPLREWKGAGAPLKALSVDPYAKNDERAFNSGEVYLAAIELPEGGTITGSRCASETTGAYTANNNSRFGLYSSDGTTLTKLAQTASSPTLLAGSGIKDVAFTAPLYLPAGMYWWACLVNWSAVTTAPTVSARLGSGLANIAQLLGGMGNVKLCGKIAGNTDLPATIAWASVIESTDRAVVGLY